MIDKQEIKATLEEYNQNNKEIARCHEIVRQMQVRNEGLMNTLPTLYVFFFANQRWEINQYTLYWDSYYDCKRHIEEAHPEYFVTGFDIVDKQTNSWVGSIYKADPTSGAWHDLLNITPEWK